MGEYAIRKSDGERIKIGTCEDMYYIRFSDRHLVSAADGNVDLSNNEHVGQLRFRLPFPDEDDRRPGDYKEFDRGLRLYPQKELTPEFEAPGSLDDPGTLQMRHEASGLMLNVPCYHGLKLPEITGAKVSVFWNGKGWSFELASLRAVLEDGELRIYPVVKCRHCRNLWRFAWDDVVPYIQPGMMAALRPYVR